MRNKLKDMFSDENQTIHGQLQFKDTLSLKAFTEALKIADKEGRAVTIEGVESILAEVHSPPRASYPISELKGITDFIIYPTSNSVEYKIQVENKEKVILFNQYREKNKIILESNDYEIIYYLITFNEENGNTNFKYKVQLKNATTIKEVFDSFSSAVEFVKTLFNDGNSSYNAEEAEALHRINESLTYSKAFFFRLLKVEKELGIFFEPSKLDYISEEEIQCIDMVYLLLCEKKVLRLNAKITPYEANVVMNPYRPKELEIGDKVSITFFEKLDYHFLGESGSLHTANLISNAIIKDIKKGDKNNSATIIYGDTDIQPMYISFSAFKSFEEAKFEKDHIMKGREKEYINALTSHEYMEILSKDITTSY